MSDRKIFLPHHYGKPIFLCEESTSDECWKAFCEMMGETKEALIKQRYSVKEML